MCNAYLKAAECLALVILSGNQVITFSLWGKILLPLLNLPLFGFNDYFSIFILTDGEEMLPFNFFYAVHSFVDFYLEPPGLSSFQEKQPQSLQF